LQLPCTDQYRRQLKSDINCTRIPAYVCQDVIDQIVSFRIRRDLILFKDYLDVGPLYFYNYNVRRGKFLPQVLNGRFHNINQCENQDQDGRTSSGETHHRS